MMDEAPPVVWGGPRAVGGSGWTYGGVGCLRGPLSCGADGARVALPLPAAGGGGVRGGPEGWGADLDREPKGADDDGAAPARSSATVSARRARRDESKRLAAGPYTSMVARTFRTSSQVVEATLLLMSSTTCHLSGLPGVGTRVMKWVDVPSTTAARCK